MTPPSPARPILRARYDGKQREVVAAAAREFADRGFHATSMQHIIAATGLTAGGLYHYIGSKDELLVRICDQLLEPLLAQVRVIVDSEASAAVQLREIVRAWMSHVEHNRDHMLVFQQERLALERGDQWQRVRGQRDAFEEMLLEVLVRGQRSGDFRFEDSDLTLRALLGMVNSTALWFRPDGRLSAEEIADGFVRLLVG